MLDKNMSFDTINIDIWGGELEWYFCNIFCPGLLLDSAFSALQNGLGFKITIY